MSAISIVVVSVLDLVVAGRVTSGRILGSSLGLNLLIPKMGVSIGPISEGSLEF